VVGSLAVTVPDVEGIAVIKQVNVSEPTELDLFARQGAHFDLDITYGDGTRDMSSDTAEMRVRAQGDPTVLMTLTHQTGAGITMGPNGSVRVQATSTQMANLPARPLLYQIDIPSLAGGEALLSGRLILSKRV
jgi:hypothetical protein